MRLSETKWVTIAGNVLANGTHLEYRPIPVPPLEPGVEPQMSFALVKSNIPFAEGKVRFRATLGERTSRVQVVLGHDTPQQVFAGTNAGSGAYGMAVLNAPSATGGSAQAPGWGANVTAGTFGTAPVGTPIDIEVTVVGSRLQLLVDGVEVANLNVEVSRSQLLFYFGGQEPCTVELLEVDAKQPTAFIVMQFTPEFDALYENVIKPTCQRYGDAPVRADDIFNNGLIIEDISRSIREASLIIADITPKNPNVFYEVGYAHAINKPTILMAERKLSALPFDVAGFRTIFYDDSIGGKSKVEERLALHLQALSRTGSSLTGRS